MCVETNTTLICANWSPQTEYGQGNNGRIRKKFEDFFMIKETVTVNYSGIKTPPQSFKIKVSILTLVNNGVHSSH